MITIPLLVHNPLKFNDPLTWLSTVQRNFCRTKYNHGALLIYDSENIFGLGVRWVVVEAVKVGVHVITFEHYKSYSKDRILGTFDVDQNTLDYKFLNSTVGYKYQFSIWWSEIAMQLSKSVSGDSKLTRYFSNINNTTRYYCFELLNDFLKSGLGYSATGFDFEQKYEVRLFDINSIKE